MRVSSKTPRDEGYDYKSDPRYSKYVQNRDTKAEYQRWKKRCLKRGKCTAVGCNAPKGDGLRFLCDKCFREADDTFTDFRITRSEVSRPPRIEMEFDLPPVKHLSCEEYTQEQLARYIRTGELGEGPC